MPTCKVDLDQATYAKLVAIAWRENRPPHWQAEVLLRKAILRESSEEESHEEQGHEGVVHP